jgi:hypothetical protein
VVEVTAVIQSLGLANLPGGQDLGLRTGVDLVGREHRQGGQRVQVVVQGVVACEAGQCGWDGGEAGGIDRLRSECAEVGVDTCTGCRCKCARVGLKRIMQPYQTVRPQLSK